MTDAPGKLIVIGIDGMDPVIAERMMGAGELPNFERLAQTGHYDRLATINPPQSPVVWASISTGASPGEHGIFDFIHRDPASYTLSLSLNRMERLRYVNPIRGTTFWERAASQRIPVTVLKWPMAFPPRPFDGRLLAGLGVPDVRGMLGTYTFFTASPEAVAANCKGQIVAVSPNQKKISTSVAGPFAASLGGRKEASVPLDIMIDGATAQCRIGKQVFSLRPGQWSPWLTVPFEVGFFRIVNGLCRFYLKSITPDFCLYLAPVNVGYDTGEFPISTPQEYATDISRAIGPYATLGMAEDTNALNDGVLSEDEFLGQCDSVMLEREQMFFHELARFKDGLLACVFDTTDRVQHMFWRMLDTGHPLHDSALAERYRGTIGRYYRWMDRIVGTIAEKAPDAGLLICSDHGFSTFRRAIHLNTWLVENGFMGLKPGAKACDGLFECVDWGRTTAYAVGFSSLYLNITGRERHGIVSPEAVTTTKRHLIEKLRHLDDNGAPVIKDAYDTAGLFGKGAAVAGAPDLLVGFSAGYRASWQTAIGGVTGGAAIEDNLKKWSGDHCCDASFVPGVLFCNNRQVAGRYSVYDVPELFLSSIGCVNNAR
jgi:predicted AlkP superfamily phosphohydrolase/phosphomutase